jgi:hypothetical protein
MINKQRPWKAIVIGLLAGTLLTGTFAATTPAIGAAPVKIGKIWQKIKPKADKRYYTKASSNARYYAKATSDARYAPKPKVLRGALVLPSTPIGGYAMTHIDFGLALSAPPTPHIIANMGVVPAGCSGTPEAPSASPGHLCIFEKASSGFGARTVCSAVNDCNEASAFGAYYFATSTTTSGFLYGSWALGIGSTTTARVTGSEVSGTGGGSPGSNQ